MKTFQQSHQHLPAFTTIFFFQCCVNISWTKFPTGVSASKKFNEKRPWFVDLCVCGIGAFHFFFLLNFINLDEAENTSSLLAVEQRSIACVRSSALTSVWLSAVAESKGKVCLTRSEELTLHVCAAWADINVLFSRQVTNRSSRNPSAPYYSTWIPPTRTKCLQKHETLFPTSQTCKHYQMCVHACVRVSGCCGWLCNVYYELGYPGQRFCCGSSDSVYICKCFIGGKKTQRGF